MRVLITGATGFAGRHLADHCRAAGDEIVAAGRAAGDLREAAAVRALVAASRPEVVFHLAAQAHVGRSWREPGATIHDNIAMALNLLQAVRDEAPEAPVVAVASGEVYGPPASLPVDESAPLRPQNPYAVSKASADLLAGLFADAHRLRVVRPRPFNHAGPGQDPTYAIGSFALQIARAQEAGEDPVRIVTGNPDTQRDYTDVRDVVRAYRLLALHGETGGIYNVCSGRPASAAELVRALAAGAGVEVIHDVDPALVRGHEVVEIRGTYEKLRAATGWEPEIELTQTLADTVAWWREEIRAGRAPARGA